MNCCDAQQEEEEDQEQLLHVAAREKPLAALQVSPVAAIFIALQLLRPSPQRVRSKAPTAFTATSNLPEPEKGSKKSKPGSGRGKKRWEGRKRRVEAGGAV